MMSWPCMTLLYRGADATSLGEGCAVKSRAVGDGACVLREGGRIARVATLGHARCGWTLPPLTDPANVLRKARCPALLVERRRNALCRVGRASATEPPL